MQQEAFVYCWTDHKTNKLYVGSHKGVESDGYICSSKYMLEEYNKRPGDFTRQIIAHGCLKDIRKLEAKILQSVGARLNEDFYNKHENDGFYFEGWKKGQMTADHRAKIVAANKGRKISKEHHTKLVNGRRGKKNSPEHKAALIASRKGTTHTEETKQKMSEAAKASSKIDDRTTRLKENRGKGVDYSKLMKTVWEKRRAGLIKMPVKGG